MMVADTMSAGSGGTPLPRPRTAGLQVGWARPRLQAGRRDQPALPRY